MNPALLFLIILAGMGLYAGYKNEKAQKEVEKTLFEKVLAPLKGLFNEFYSNKGLVIDDILDDHILINTPYKNLYGVKLEGSGNTPIYFDEIGVKEIFRTYQNTKDAFFWYVILKNGYYHGQYLFSYNQNLLKSIANKYKLTFLSGAELANAVLDLFLQNQYFIKDKDIHRTVSLNFNSRLESNYQTFAKLARENIYQNLCHTDLYQSYKALEGAQKTNIQNIFRMGFDGAIWTYFNLSRKSVENHISRLINFARWTGNKSHFTALKEAYDIGDQQLVIVNSVACFKSIDESIIGDFGTSLKMDYIKKNIFKTRSLQKTPFKFRDSEFDFLASESFFSNFIACVHKKNVKNADFWGYDKNGGFINYSFAAENHNPHAVIVADPGAGKSFTLQKIISSMLDIDYKTRKARNLNKDKVIVRYYDIGFSSRRLIDFLKENQENSIARVESDLANFSYNIVNLDDSNKETYEADLIFSADLINLILSSQSTGSQSDTQLMTLGEISLYQDILRQIYEGKAEYQDYRVRDIKNQNLKNKILKQGFSINEYLKNLGDEYGFLKKPLLIDVIKYAKIQSENQQIPDDIRENFQGLHKKLTDVDKLNLFSNFDTEDTINANFLSMELNNFKENSLFVPIFVSIFQKTYLKDRSYAVMRMYQGLSVSKKAYVVEEVANYFRIPYFAILFDKLALEARKYGVYFILIGQKLVHIPERIIGNIDTRIFLLAPDKKREFIDEVKKILNPGQNVIDRLEDTDEYELCVWYSRGVFNLKLPVSKFEEKLFNTDPTKVAKVEE